MENGKLEKRLKNTVGKREKLGLSCHLLYVCRKK